MRKIIHVDMDAFYAAVEQRDNPQLRGKPVVVSGSPQSRSVVSTASYEARKYGIHSAMPSFKAKQLCPEAIFVYPRFEVYQSVSKQIREIFFDYTDMVEPLSLDEAYLDVTESYGAHRSAGLLALKIKERIFKTTGLTASAGVSYNKFLAKVGSDFEKPNGLTVIPPERALKFIADLPVGKFFGIGKVTEKKMNSLGIKFGRDLQALSEEELRKYFGKQGKYYFLISRGIELREVKSGRERKSVGKERTFQKDILDIDEAKNQLRKIANTLSESLKKKEIRGKTLTLKVRYNDFERISRAVTFKEESNDADLLFEKAVSLIEKTEIGKRKVRLLGISLSKLSGKTYREYKSL